VRSNTVRRDPTPGGRRIAALAGRCRAWSWRYHQPIADAAHRLDVQRVGRIALDLAAQAIDLHVHGPLADGVAVAAGEVEPRHDLARGSREQAHHLALAI